MKTLIFLFIFSFSLSAYAVGSAAALNKDFLNLIKKGNLGYATSLMRGEHSSKRPNPESVDQEKNSALIIAVARIKSKNFFHYYEFIKNLLSVIDFDKNEIASIGINRKGLQNQNVLVLAIENRHLLPDEKLVLVKLLLSFYPTPQTLLEAKEAVRKIDDLDLFYDLLNQIDATQPISIEDPTLPYRTEIPEGGIFEIDI